MAADLAALKNWVTAADGEQFSRLPEGVVSVNISHSNITARMIELKFDLSQTLGDVKGKIYTHCGTNPGMQKLSLRSGGQTMCQLDDDSKKLGFYGVQSGMEIHVTDDDPFSLTRGGALEDLSRVQKYRMSEEDYDKREGTLRSWVKEQKAKDSTWVEPWIEKEREAKRAAGKAPSVSDQKNNVEHLAWERKSRDAKRRNKMFTYDATPQHDVCHASPEPRIRSSRICPERKTATPNKLLGAW